MLHLGDQHGNPVKPKITENSKYGDKRDRVVNNYLIKHPEWRWTKKKKFASELIILNRSFLSDFLWCQNETDTSDFPPLGP